MTSRAQQLMELRAARRAAAEAAVTTDPGAVAGGQQGAGREVCDPPPPPPPAGRVIEGVRVIAREQRWTSALVRARLDEAMKTLRRMGGAVGPKAFGNGMPEPVRGPLTLKDLIEQMHDPSLHRVDGNKIRLSAISAEVSRAEEAIAWAWDYLPDDGPRRVLQAWLRSRAEARVKFSRLCKDKGWPRSTANFALARAFRIISAALNDTGVAVR